MYIANHTAKTLKKVCAGKNDRREYLQHCHLDAENQHLWATNGSIVARLAVAMSDGDTSGPVTIESLSAAESIQKSTRQSAEITANGSLDIKDGPSFPRPDCGKFPDVSHVLKQAEAKPEYEITINAKLLHDLAASISSNGKDLVVTLSFTGNQSPIKVTNKTKHLGILMPCRN